MPAPPRIMVTHAAGAPLFGTPIVGYRVAPQNYTEAAPGPGRKDDSGKLRMDLIPVEALIAVTEAAYRTDGANDNAPGAKPGARDLLAQSMRELAEARGLSLHPRESLARAAVCCLRLADPNSQEAVPGRALEDVARVLEFGARKYGENNWQKVEDGKRRYYAAALRHLTALSSGRKADPDTGLSDAAHAACCIFFLIALEAA